MLFLIAAVVCMVWTVFKASLAAHISHIDMQQCPTPLLYYVNSKYPSLFPFCLLIEGPQKEDLV